MAEGENMTSIRLTRALLLASSVMAGAPLLAACEPGDTQSVIDENPLAAGDDFVAIQRDIEPAHQRLDAEVP